MHTFRQLEKKYSTYRWTASRLIRQRYPTAAVLIYKKVACFVTFLKADGGAWINQCIGADLCFYVWVLNFLKLFLLMLKLNEYH